MKVSGVSREGLRGHDQAPQLPSRPGLPRLAQHSGAGIDRRLRRPGTGLQGHPRARANGQPARHPARPRGRGRAPRENLLLVRGSVPGPKGSRRGDQGEGPMATAAFIGSAARAGSTSTTPCSPRASTGRWCTRPFAPSWRASPRDRLDQDARRGLHDRRQGLAPEGHRRARAGALSTPQRTGGGVAFGPKPRSFTVKVNRKARRRAARGAHHARRARLDRRD